MTRAELLNRIPAQDWEATPSSVRNLLLALVEGESEAGEMLSRLPSSDESKPVFIKRYQELTDRLFLRGLNAEETQELERLGEQIDRANAPFYDAALRRMEAVSGHKE